jgi:hypothetical protein
MSSVLGGMAADLGFNGIEFADFRQHPGGKRRLGGDVELVESAPHLALLDCRTPTSERTEPRFGDAVEDQDWTIFPTATPVYSKRITSYRHGVRQAMQQDRWLTRSFSSPLS